MKERVLKWLLIGLTGGLISCANEITEFEPTILENLDPGVVVDADFQSIQNKVFTPGCAVAGCHVSGGQFPLLAEGFAYNSIVNMGSMQKTGEVLVIPNDAANSYLFQKVSGAAGILGTQMPQVGTPLSRGILDSIAAWINKGAKENEDEPNPEPMLMAARFSAIQDSIFSLSCALANCHNGDVAGIPNLLAGNAYNNIVNTASGQSSLQLIEPFEPDNSYLYLKITGAPGIQGEQMPRGGSMLRQTKIDSVREWIAQGALNN